MMYVVTTNYFEGAPLFGIFSTMELAYEALHEWVRADDNITIFDYDGGYYIMDRNNNIYDVWIELAYPNASLV